MNDHRRPANDRLIVREVDVEHKTKSGIFLGESIESPVMKTQILACSESTKTPYRVGFYAWIQKTAGLPLPEGDLVISEGHILYVTEE